MTINRRNRLAASATRVAVGLDYKPVKQPAQSLQQERKPHRRAHRQVEIIPEREKQDAGSHA
jgi:hypothetical protein